MNEKDLLKIDEVVEVLGVSRSKVYDYINDKDNPLPVIYLSDRTPRVKRAALQEWVDRQAELQKDQSNKKSENEKGGEQ